MDQTGPNALHSNSIIIPYAIVYLCLQLQTRPESKANDGKFDNTFSKSLHFLVLSVRYREIRPFSLLY